MSQVLNFLTANPWAAYLAFGLLSLVLSRKSQVDAWANAHPRVAGVMKLLRSLGLDPWVLWQGAHLIVAKRLPGTLKVEPTIARVAALEPLDPFPPPPPAPSKRRPSVPPGAAACFFLVLLALGCGSEAPAMRAPTAAELEQACPGALKVATLDCPALAVASCRGFESLDECPAGASVRLECSRLREEALSKCR